MRESPHVENKSLPKPIAIKYEVFKEIKPLHHSPGGRRI
jgi:hypothetical protein